MNAMSNKLVRFLASGVAVAILLLGPSSQLAFGATVNDNALTAEISSAQSFAQYAVVGTAPGDCSQADLNALNSAISAAQSVVNDSTADQSTVDAAVTTLTNAVARFEATGVNLVPNPGFETGALAPWTTQNNATVEANNAHSGTYAANLGGTTSGVQQTITGLIPNTTYVLTAWVKTPGDVVYLGAENFAGSGSQVNAVTTSSTYTQMKVTFTTNSTSTSVYVFLWKQFDTGPAYGDDFSLTEANTGISGLTSEISIAHNIASNAIVGPAPGDCTQTDLNALSAAISTAEAVANNPTSSQSAVASAITTLTDAVAAFEATGVNLIPNGGFETGSLAPWTTQNDATVEQGNAHSGLYAANLGGASSGVQQTISGLTPNTTYTLTAWVKTPGDGVYLGAENFAGSGSQVNAITTSSSYTQLKVTFTTDSTSTSAYIFLWKSANSGPAYADDIMLREIPLYTTQKYNGQDIGFNTQDPYFVGSTSLNQLYDQVAKTGAKWVRATLFWDLMEPTQGQIDWTQADKIFNAVKSHGFKYDMVIRSAPSWAANGADTSNHNYAPTNAAAFEDFCYQVAKRYLGRGVTIVFEIGNEENTQFFNMPAVDPAEYTKDMLIPGSTGIRQAAKDLGVAPPTILVGGLAPVDPQYVPNSMTPLDFMKAIYANGGKGYFNSIAYHPYTYVSAPAPTNWTFTELQSIISLMNSEGDTNRKVYATEVGWATGTGAGEISETDQANFTGEEFDQWFSLPYAGPMIWYELVDNQSNDNSNRENTFGLMDSTYPWAPKPAYNVFVSKVATLDTSALDAKIAQAQSLSQSAVIGTVYGDYAQASVDTLNAAIATAQSQENDPTAVQSTIGSALVTLTNAVDAFQASAVQDHVPPVTTATLSAQPNAAGWYHSNVTVTLQATDNTGGSGVAQIVYSVAGAQNTAETTVVGATANIVISGEGTSTLTFHAVDKAGNVEAQQQIQVQLDKTPPTIQIASPTNGTYTDDEALPVTFDLSDSVSGVNTSFTKVTLDGQPWSSGEPLNYTLPLGSHTLSVTAGDNAGNVATQTVKFDMTTTTQSMQQLVQQFLANGSIDNHGIANSLEQKLQQDDLKSFENEVQAQTGKHIDSTAATYLQRDAAWLLNH